MTATYKTVTEETYIECDSFESALTEAAKLGDSESIVISKVVIEENTFWTVFSNEKTSEDGEMIGAPKDPDSE